MLDYYIELPSDTNVTQLKYSPKQQIMYALHDDGLVISCWNVGTNPEFCMVIKPPLNVPGKINVLSVSVQIYHYMPSIIITVCVMYFAW